MINKLKKYKNKRNFQKTKEPVGEKIKESKKLRFVVQHHIASRDHYDFRLEWKGVLKSWAVPKGPSYNPKDKRLAIMVEDHPLEYRNFEGTIPKGEYGGGTVMIWDQGTWEPIDDVTDKSIKFILKGKRLKGMWTLVKMEENNWLLIKEKDKYSKDTSYIDRYKRSIKTNKTMEEISEVKTKKTKKKETIEKCEIEGIEISNPNKILFDKSKITKKELALYYQKVYKHMKPYLDNRIISTIRCPDGIKGECFFKKHLDGNNKYFGKINIASNDNEKDDYYYIKNIKGLISEVQMNSIEFHIWGSKVRSLEKPDIMVFDLDPDEKIDLEKLRQGVKDLKSILDELSLKSFLKTSGGKGYHILVPFKPCANWEKFKKFSKNIALAMEKKWPDRYVSNVRKINRKNKIFIDWIRNTKSATSVAPYSVRKKDNATVSMPIKWSELKTIAPADITIKEAFKRLKRKDPWQDFFKIKQELNE